MKLGRLNHIGVATPSIADSIAFYRDVMGATTIHEPFDMPDQGVKVCFVDTPGPLTGSGQSESRSEEHTSELVTNAHLVCRLLLEKKKHHTHINARTHTHQI